MTDVAREGSKTNEFVRSLIKKGVSDYEAMTQLRRQYPSDEEFIGKMYDLFKERMDLIRSKAKKFKDLLVVKYSTLTLPQLIEKGKKFKKKYGFSDEEYETFIKYVTTDKTYDKMAEYNVPRGEMAKVLGYSELSAVFGNKLSVKPNELDVLQQIMKIYSSSLQLHHSVIMQSFQNKNNINDVFETMNRTYDPSKVEQFSFVNPVIAALFLPHIDVIENRMIYANIGQIVKNKYEGKMIDTQPDFYLYSDLASDPNDILSITKGLTPLTDLRNRANVQVKLWENILNLRVGNIYHKCGNELIAELDKCGGNVFDAPDFTFVRDEGTILRKLMGVFSLRPTYVQITPEYGEQQLLGQISTIGGYTKVTNIPMINVRLSLYSKTEDLQLSKFTESTTQKYVENKMMVQKKQSILWNKGILIFYVNRRNSEVSFQIKQLGIQHLGSVMFDQLPVTMFGMDQINRRQIIVEEQQTFSGSQPTLKLTSCVVFNMMKKSDEDDSSNFVIGTGAIIYDIQTQIPTHYYIPHNIENGKFVPHYNIDPGMVDDIRTLICTQGTIYIYSANEMFAPRQGIPSGTISI